MRPLIIRKAPYRLPGTTRLVWAAVISESQGLSMLFVKKPDDKWHHELVIATENIKERCYESANTSRFPVEPVDLHDIAQGLAAFAEGLAYDELENFFKSEGLL